MAILFAPLMSGLYCQIERGDERKTTAPIYERVTDISNRLPWIVSWKMWGVLKLTLSIGWVAPTLMANQYFKITK